jgi:hypothetical protein
MRKSVLTLVGHQPEPTVCDDRTDCERGDCDCPRRWTFGPNVRRLQILHHRSR